MEKLSKSDAALKLRDGQQSDSHCLSDCSEDCDESRHSNNPLAVSPTENELETDIFNEEDQENL